MRGYSWFDVISDSGRGRFLSVFVPSGRKCTPDGRVRSVSSRCAIVSQKLSAKIPTVASLPHALPVRCSTVFESLDALFLAVFYVFTSDVSGACVNADALLVSAGDRNIVEAQMRASRVLSVPSSFQFTQTRQFPA